ncbi:MAG TPA: hypothetical protein VGN16_06920 [Acidobacteriaceae bacterium]|jgi:hypothetical protein
MPRSVNEEYETRRSAAQSEYEQWQQRSSTFVLACLPLLIYGVILGAKAFRGDTSHWLAFAITWLAAGAAGVGLMHARRRSNVGMRRAIFYEQGLARLNGEVTQTGHTGEAYAPPNHVYARDLNVIGPHSLFGMLAITRTALGHEALADSLLTLRSADEARLQQGAIQELTSAYELREQVALLGRSDFEQVPADSFANWLREERRQIPQWLQPLLLVSNVLWLALLVAGFVGHLDQPTLLRNVAAALALQGALCLSVRTTVQEELDGVERLAGQAAIVRNGLRLLTAAKFTSEHMLALQKSAEGDDRALARLQRLLALEEQRAKEWYYAPALLLSVGTHTAIGLQRWKRQYAVPMQRWLRAWSEFDALLALSTYAVEHPEHVYARFESAHVESAVFVAEEMKHPLLPAHEAVANDITLDAQTRFLLISGSNMAGKSTLLRAMGANAVLALAGLPVPARSLRLGAAGIGASLAITDSLAERKSKFLAEVERLRAIVALAEKERAGTLFLIDEILSGTNSLDRKASAEAVLLSLLEAGAVGAISTHDLTLTALAEMPQVHGRNVHMASPDEDDPLGFDYKLKDGVNQTTNALAIVRMLGLAKK